MERQNNAGTTVSVVLVTGPLVTVANIGDSSAVLDTGFSMLELTTSHRIHDRCGGGGIRGHCSPPEGLHGLNWNLNAHESLLTKHLCDIHLHSVREQARLTGAGCKVASLGFHLQVRLVPVYVWYEYSVNMVQRMLLIYTNCIHTQAVCVV